MKTDATARVLTDPVADRLEREGIVARALARALAETRATDTLLAAELDVRPRRLRAWRDPHAGESVPAAMLLGLPPVVRRPLVALLAESLGCALVDLPGADASTDGARLSLVAGAAKESGEAVAALVARANSEMLTEPEADHVLAEIAEAVEALIAAKSNVLMRRRRVGPGSTR